MTKPTTLRCWLLALALVLASPAWANRLALVIGNNAYQKVERLENARNDANRMATVLKKAGFDVTQASDVSHRALWDAIDTFKGRIQKGDEVVFYYAGHGVQINSNQLLLPVDIEAKNDAQVQRDGVPLIDVQDALKDARFAMLVIDACRDNPFPKVGTRAIVGGTRGLIPPEPGTGQIIMMSAGRNQKALDRVPGERQANGLFTWELVRVIQTPGVEIRNALEQVKIAVDDKARRAGHEQRPSLVNDLTGNFYFFASTMVQAQGPDTAADAEAKTWAAADRVNSSSAYQAYLDTYPKGRYEAAARIALSGLQKVPTPTRPETQVQAAPKPVARLTPDLSVELTSISDRENGLVTSFVIRNESNKPLLIALNNNSLFCADFRLTDGQGGYCEACTNGERRSSLNTVYPGSMSYSAAEFSTIGAMSSAQHILTFYKFRCSSQIRDTSTLSFNGTFLVMDGRLLSRAPVSFSGIQAVK